MPAEPRGGVDVAKLVEWFIAPTTLLVGLAYHFGREFTLARTSYYHLDASLLDFEPRDYIVRSLDPLFLPLGALVLGALVGLSVHRWIVDPLLSREASGRRLVRALVRLLEAAGVLFLLCGIAAVFGELPFPVPHLIPPLLPGLGVLAMAYGAQLSSRDRPDAVRRPGRSTASILVGAFLVLSLFWAATVYATSLGSGRAQALAKNLASLPGVTVLSQDDLHLSGPGVTATTSSQRPAERYPYRYEGLRLMLKSKDQLFLIPEGWSRAQGSVVVLAANDRVRFEFHH